MSPSQITEQPMAPQGRDAEHKRTHDSKNTIKVKQSYISLSQLDDKHARIQNGGKGSGPPPPLKNNKNIEFHSNTGPDLQKITKLPSQHPMLDDGPFIVVF